MYVAEGNSTFPPNANVITLEEEGAWIYFIIDNLEGTFVRTPFPNPSMSVAG